MQIINKGINLLTTLYRVGKERKRKKNDACYLLLINKVRSLVLQRVISQNPSNERKEWVSKCVDINQFMKRKEERHPEDQTKLACRDRQATFPRPIDMYIPSQTQQVRVSLIQLICNRARIKLSEVRRVFGEQIKGVSGLDDAAGLEDDDCVVVEDGVELVGDGENSVGSELFPDDALEDLVCFGVHAVFGELVVSRWEV